MARQGVQWKISLDLPEELIPSARRHIVPLIGAISEAARAAWVTAARQRLHTSARGYINSISPVSQRGSKATIRLMTNTPEGKLANMMEEGHAPFDMKPGFLRGPKAKHGDRGPYAQIPIAKKTGGGSSPNTMPWSIYRVARATPVGKPLKLPPRLETVGMMSRLSPDPSKWSHYTWKASPFQGIIRTPQFPGQLRSPMKYGTIRTVSRRSDPNSWIHPGFQARNVMEVAAAELERIAPAIVERVLGVS